MYIIELLFNALKKRKKKFLQEFEPIVANTDGLIEDSQDCNHLFMPLDSTNEMFACKHCGIVVQKEKLKNKNIFENKSF